MHDQWLSRLHGVRSIVLLCPTSGICQLLQGIFSNMYLCLGCFCRFCLFSYHDFGFLHVQFSAFFLLWLTLISIRCSSSLLAINDCVISIADVIEGSSAPYSSHNLDFSHNFFGYRLKRSGYIQLCPIIFQFFFTCFGFINGCFGSSVIICVLD